MIELRRASLLALSCVWIPASFAAAQAAQPSPPLVFEVESRADAAAATIPGEDLPVLRTLPDPFRPLAGGERDTRPESWSQRRAEVQASLERYEIGPKPDADDLEVAASFASDTLTVVVTRRSNGRSITLTSPIFLPEGEGPFPAIIGMTWRLRGEGGGSGSLPADIFTSRNIARIPFFHDQVTLYREFGPGDPYFHLYPEHGQPGEVGQYSAWSWGVSRLIDGIQLAARAGTLPIDTGRLAVTGCSYAGKMALFAGALDERVALTIAQESGGGGAPAWRVSHGIEPDGSVEKTDNTNGAWFMQSMKERFRGDEVYRLPHDHHQLVAMVAPRALLVTGNTDYVWLSNRSTYVTARAAEAVYETLGIGDRFGFYINGGYGHCQIPDEHRPSIEAFVDRFLLGKDADTEVRVHPFGDLDYQEWMPWAQ